MMEGHGASSSLGLESGVVRLVPYDPSWPALFAAESRRILDVCHAHGVSLVLEHTGSTAVPGLDAKPILDILAGRAAESDRAAAIAALVAAGYTYRGEQGILGRDFFRRGEPRSHHVHLTTVGGTFWQDHRAFRDYLRAHPDEAAEYARVKHELAARFPRDRESYIDGKGAFVARILSLAAAEL
jgi:GrpB-like predicted nucleotidyltransferase (UPF0157 family)